MSSLRLLNPFVRRDMEPTPTVNVKESAVSPLMTEAGHLARSALAALHGCGHFFAKEETKFWKFRPYQGGESVTLIDWKQSARTDSLFVRERENKKAESFYFWIDKSPSMMSRDGEKIRQAHLLFVALTYLLLSLNEKATWLDKSFVALQGLSSLKTLGDHLDLEKTSNVPSPHSFPDARNGHVVFCSDFVTEPQAIIRNVYALAENNRSGLVFHIKNPYELSPGTEKNDLALRQTVKKIGWVYQEHLCNASLNGALLRLFDAAAESR